MSLQDIKDELQSKISGGDLEFGAVGAQVSSLGLVLAELPPVSAFLIAGAQLDLSGAGPSQALSIAGTVGWELLPGTTVMIVVSADPSDATRYAVSVRFDAPASATLSIPGIPWFELGSFQIRGQSQPAADAETGLVPQALVSIGTTLLISGDSSRTPIPIAIGTDPTGALMVSLDTSAIVLPSINDVLAAFGDHASAIQLPTTINDLLSFSLEQLLVCFNPATRKVTQIGVQIGKEATDKQAGWPIIPGFFTLDSYTLGLNIVDPLGTAQVGGLVSATGRLGSVDIGVSALHPASGGWTFSGYLGKEDGVPIGELVGGLARQFGVTLPAALASFTLKDFEFSFDTSTYDASARFTVDFEVSGKPIEITIAVALQRQTANPNPPREITDPNAPGATANPGTATRYDVTVDGVIRVGPANFHIKFVSGQDSIFLAEWAGDPDNPLELADIAQFFGFTLPDIPPGLDLALVEASFTYDFTQKSLVLTAKSQNYGNAVFLADTPANSPGVYAFGVKVPFDVYLADIPVIGGKIPDGKQIGILDAGVWVLSGQLTSQEVTDLNRVIRERGLDGPFLPVGGLTALVLLSATLQLGPAGTDPLQLALGSGAPGAHAPTAGQEPQPTARTTADLQAAGTLAGGSPDGTGEVTPPPQSPDGAHWLEVNKAIGPVTLQRVGMKYAGSQLYFLVDIGLSADGLTIDLAGLAVSSPLTTFDPSFHLSGLDLGFKSSVFEIAGEFLNVPVGQLPPGAEFEYAGAATLTVADFDLTALGSYGRINGQTSVFVFAVLDYPLGGPAFFFVTGAAAGFGYNRRLILPAVEDVPNFPLVAATINPASVFPGGSDKKNSLGQAMGVLDKYIPMSPGDYFLAAGIRFTTFEMIASVALLSVAFGNRLEIALLGDSQLSIPADPTGENPDNPKIAHVELALEVRIDPDEGDFKAAAVLTPNSWVLSPDCRLTGGFAFYIWYGGEHAGDFVITVGGYHPQFQPPSWYPNVPRLGINWTLSSVLTIKGGSYFALTPHAIMAGGSLEVVFQVGGLRAWLTAYADFLIEWQPFHYEIDIGISVGVSLTFSLFGATITLSLEIGASLELWGPPFGGRATIHLWIISFTIPFGDQTPVALPLTFEQFNTALLPKAQDTGQQEGQDRGVALAATAGGDTQAGAPIFIVPSITAGIIESPASNSNLTMPLVAAGALEIQVTTHWPATQLYKGPADGAPGAAGQQIYSYPGSVYASPMQGTDPFTGTLTVEILYDGDSHNDYFVFDPILKSAPTALWSMWDEAGPGINPPKGPDGNPAATIPGVPFGIRVRAGSEHDLDPGKAIPLENFAFQPEQFDVSWPHYRLPAEISGDALDKITATITAPDVAATRTSILQRLNQLTADEARQLPGTVTFSPEFVRQPDDLFLDVPVVASLGQVPDRGSV
jgi:Family of unknown function (DUF6603)